MVSIRVFIFALKQNLYLYNRYKIQLGERDKLLLFQIPETLNLNDLPEGHIGKLRFRKSGKVEMVINDNKCFDVTLSVCGPFLQVSERKKKTI